MDVLRFVEPPSFPVSDCRLCEHGIWRDDPFKGLANLKDPRVREYLEANNQHLEAVLAPATALRNELFAEMRRRMPTNEGQAPWRLGNDWLALRYLHDAEYPSLVRRRGAADGPDETLFDGPALAQGHKAFSIGSVQVSPNRERLVIAADFDGRHLYTLYVVELCAQEQQQKPCPILSKVEPMAAWSADSQALIYVRPDPESLRPNKVYLHYLDNRQAEDLLLYEEQDESFRCYVSQSRSGRFIFIHAYAAGAEETFVLPADNPLARPQTLYPRAADTATEADHDGKTFVLKIVTPDGAGRLIERVDPAGDKATEKLLAEVSPDICVDTFAVFRNYIALVEYREGRPHVRIIERTSGESHDIALPDPVFQAWFDANPDPESSVLRMGYTSLITPLSYYDYDMAKRVLTLKAREAPAGFEESRYAMRFLLMPARDGELIPVTIAGELGALEQGNAPTMLFGYGAYGTNMPLTFDEARLSLYDRGFLYGAAHVRGGSERGHAWHEAGRLQHKRRSSLDFEDAVEGLVKCGLVSSNAFFAETLSAGGLMLGDVLNRRPDLFRGAVIHEGFMDLLNGMTDPDYPWTTFEYGEWGRPDDPADWARMREYSPYDNIKAQQYPCLLATAAWNDEQVPCCDPAKWIARLRLNNTGSNQALLCTHFEAGHGGETSRTARIRFEATVAAWLLSLAQ